MRRAAVGRNPFFQKQFRRHSFPLSPSDAPVREGRNPDPPLQLADRAGVRRLSPEVRSLPRDAPPDGAGRTGNHRLPDPSGRRRQGERLDAEPGAERAALSLCRDVLSCDLEGLDGIVRAKRAVREAVPGAGIAKLATCHTLRRSPARWCVVSVGARWVPAAESSYEGACSRAILLPSWYRGGVSCGGVEGSLSRAAWIPGDRKPPVGIVLGFIGQTTSC